MYPALCWAVSEDWNLGPWACEMYQYHVKMLMMCRKHSKPGQVKIPSLVSRLWASDYIEGTRKVGSQSSFRKGNKPESESGSIWKAVGQNLGAGMGMLVGRWGPPV